MEGSDGSPPPSLCMIRAAELFPKPQMEKEDTQLVVPFQELAGESVRYLGRTDDGVLALSNYRIFLLKNSTNSETSVPLGLIESAQSRDLFHLIVNCKDASTVKCSFETAEQCSEWQRRIQLSVGVPETLESLFAFPFCSWTCDGMANGGGCGSSAVNGEATQANPFSFVNGGEHLSSLSSTEYSERLQRASRFEDDFMREVERLGFDLNGSWRISNVNDEFKLCPSYPQKILVPCCISDEMLHTVSNFRGSRRLPAVVWRHKKSGAVLARCSQPEVGWLGWRNAKDEQLLKAIADACAFDRGEQMRRLTQTTSFGMPTTTMLPTTSGDSSPCSPDSSHEEVALDEVRKVLIVDARSYTSAVTNRARGGGCECIEYYPCAEIEFMNLGNIHVIRKSFHALRQLCATPADVPNWLSMLEKTMWLQHLSGLLAATVTVCHAIEKKGQPVLVHCSDGWDRTPQIVATAQLCLDPYYRTVEGFRVLVEREWLSYGHKFADRCGHGPGSDEQNERCPVFLQWLDLVHQIHKKFPCSFEFSMGYLIKLAQHSLSCLFGTFFCNTQRERIENSVFERTFSVWPFLSGPMYRNPLYVSNREKVLWPAHNLRDISLWTEVYLGSLGNQNTADFPPCTTDGLQGSISPMAKTRSYGDLITAGIIQNGISRRSSDPNMTVDPNLTIGSNSENNSIADMHSEREDSPDFIANLIHDTTRQLQNLTIELNNHDDENYSYLQKPLKPETSTTVASKLEDSTNSTTESTNAPITMQKLLQQKQNSFMEQLEIKNTTASVSGAAATSFYSSPLNMQQIGCEINSTSAPLTSVPCAISSFSASTLPLDQTQQKEQQPNSFNGLLNPPLNDIATVAGSSNNLSNATGLHKSGITIETSDDMLNMDLMQSVDLSEPTVSHALTANNTEAVIKNGLLGNGLDDYENPWHGSVHTSTDTLVPNEVHPLGANTNNCAAQNGENDDIDGICTSKGDQDDGGGGGTGIAEGVPKTQTTSNLDLTKDERKSSISFVPPPPPTQCSILPKIHSRPNLLTTSTTSLSSSTTSLATAAATAVASSTSVSAVANTSSSSSYSSPALNGFNSSKHTNYTNNNNNNYYVGKSTNISNSTEQSNGNHNSFNNNKNIDVATTTAINPMEESILILPAHQKLEISISGKCETINNGMAATTTTTATPQSQTAANYTTRTECDAPITNTAKPFSFNAPLSSSATQVVGAPLANTTAGAAAQRRRRTSSSNSRRDGFNTKVVNGSTISKFSVPGVRSLPLTPPGLPERAQIAISCPDGLAHALSEQNIRLQQIVHEHKLREDLLLREIHDMRMALLKKTCPNCNNATMTTTTATTNDEQCSALDNIENASICSWEAVEDRSGPPSSSCTSSSIQANATSSVLWVPDHAVSRCTSCQTEFWLGRRKHHCRSCGQIFCADCSEFWAPLPDEKLFSPVRLCGPCYHSVTTRMQLLQHSQIQNSNAVLLKLQQSANSAAVTATTTTTNAAAAAVAVAATVANTAQVMATTVSAAAAAASTKA